MSQRILSTEAIQAIYEKWSRHYDVSLWLFYLLGFRVNAYRKAAIQRLKLEAGDTVIDLGCGTGLNFKMLQRCVGPTGSIIGVDLSEDMLAKARMRVKKSAWENVSFVQSDMADYEILENADGILSTLAISMAPEYDQIIKRASHRLATGKCMAIFELKNLQAWPDWLVKMMVMLLKSYGVRMGHTKRTPCNSIKRHFASGRMQQFYFGSVCVSMGVA